MGPRPPLYQLGVDIQLFIGRFYAVRIRCDHIAPNDILLAAGSFRSAKSLSRRSYAGQGPDNNALIALRALCSTSPSNTQVTISMSPVGCVSKKTRTAGSHHRALHQK